MKHDIDPSEWKVSRDDSLIADSIATCTIGYKNVTLECFHGKKIHLSYEDRLGGVPHITSVDVPLYVVFEMLHQSGYTVTKGTYDGP
jgi:hypothetical protein